MLQADLDRNGTQVIEQQVDHQSKHLAQPDSQRGTVNALELKAGDRILFGKWSGTEVKVDGEELLIMKESDILGVIA